MQFLGLWGYDWRQHQLSFQFQHWIFLIRLCHTHPAWASFFKRPDMRDTRYIRDFYSLLCFFFTKDFTSQSWIKRQHPNLIAQSSLPLIPAEAQCVACLESAHTILLVTADKKLTPASPGLTAHSDSPGAQGISHTDSCQARIVICYVKLRLSSKLNPHYKPWSHQDKQSWS